MTQFKLRLPEPLRAELEESKRRSGNSLNTEIVQRLDRSVRLDQALGSREMARLSFTMAAAFAVNTQGEDWSADPVAYAKGAGAVISALIRGVPAGGDQRLARQAIISTVMSLLAQDEEQSK
jgi:hypothetical protein